jgi:DNA-binding FadR family transcriptional regulator
LALSDLDFGIRPVRAQPTYELVVDQIRRALALGRFSAGDTLPPERELAQQLGVSRTVVREAIRVLEGEGLIQVTRGATGGSRVLPAGGTQRLSREEVRRQTDEIDQVSEFRLATECAAARAAALKRTKADVAALRELVTRCEEMLEAAATTDDEAERARLTTRFIELDHRLHLAIAAASRNHYLAEAVETARINMHRPVGSIFVVTIGDVSAHHREIVDAIAAKDADAAAEAMAAHIEDTRSSAVEQLTRRASKG